MSQLDPSINPLAYWRGMRGLTVEKLAEKSGVGTATITRIENWKVQPNLSTLHKLAGALDIGFDQLIGLASLPKNQPATANHNGAGWTGVAGSGDALPTTS